MNEGGSCCQLFSLDFPSGEAVPMYVHLKVKLC